MIEKIKSVYRFKNVAEIVDILSSLNSNQRPYQYAFLDPESNPVMVELRKMNNKIESIVERIEAIERGQKDIREALGVICNQTPLGRQGSSSSGGSGSGGGGSHRSRNVEYHV